MGKSQVKASVNPSVKATVNPPLTPSANPLKNPSENPPKKAAVSLTENTPISPAERLCQVFRQTACPPCAHRSFVRSDNNYLHKMQIKAIYYYNEIWVNVKHGGASFYFLDKFQGNVFKINTNYLHKIKM